MTVGDGMGGTDDANAVGNVAERATARTSDDAAMTAEAPRSSPSDRVTSPVSRLMIAIRQAAVLALGLVIAGPLVEMLRPSGAPLRDIFSSPFVWAGVLWAVVLIVDATVFEKSQLRSLERDPLLVASLAAVVTLAIGLLTFDYGNTFGRVVYLVANAGGALLFWWAITSLVWLASRR